MGQYGKKGLRIVRLEASNVKRLKAIEIAPNGEPLVVLGGRNGQGKSSVLDAIAYALAGKRAQPTRPVRDGASKAEILVDLGDIEVRRSITSTGGGSLRVVAKDGTKFSGPQSMLDRLCGALTFDPLDFARMKPKDQAETLRQMTGLDFTDLDRRRAELLEERRLANREAKNLRAMAESLPVFGDVPDEDVRVEELVAEIDRRREANAENAAHRQAVRESHESIVRLRADEEELVQRLSAVRLRIAAEAEALEKLEAAKLVDLEVDSVIEQLKTAGETNKRIAANRKAAETLDAAEKAEAAALAVQLQVEGIDREKELMLKESSLPVKGLAFDADGVTFRGVPFDQASQAEQLKVSVALGLAANPDIRVLLIRDGAVLDEESLAMVARMAAKRDAQVWVERVGEGEEVQVVIENGVIAERNCKSEVS